MVKMLLTAGDRKRIEQAVADAEVQTRGEIVCVLAEEASDYREAPLMWAAAIALAAPTIPLTLMSVVITLRQVFQGWETTEWVSAQSLVVGMAMLASMQFGLFLLVALLGLIPAVRRYLTPGMLKQEYARQRAFEQFVGKGLADTAERTGVLLYVSLKDRRAELIADSGINSKVPANAWKGVIDQMVKGARAKRPADGIVAAIQDCGRLLAEHFPAQSRNPNELPDKLTELPRR
jgi:putative membrane protein